MSQAPKTVDISKAALSSVSIGMLTFEHLQTTSRDPSEQ